MAQGPPPKTVGDRLREAREKRGVSLRQIANTTRISMMSLEALEKSDLTRLPGGIFTRAFIRAYAREVGLDPDRTIQDFIAELPPEAAHVTARPVMSEDGEKLESDRKAATTALRIVMISLPIAGAVLYFNTHRAPMFGRNAAPAIVQSHATADHPAPAVSEPAAFTASAPAVVASTPPPSTGLTMEIAPRGACWVSVTVDGEPSFSALLNAGEKRHLSAKEEVLVTVGDAGAFVYTLNGSPGKPLGAPGEVVSKRINLTNYRDLLNH